MFGDRCAVVWSGGSATARLPVEVDACNSPSVHADLMAVLDRGATALLVDMSATTFCDCSGVAAVVRAFYCARARGVEFRLVAGHPLVRRVFELTKVDRFVPVHPDAASAHAMLSLERRYVGGTAPRAPRAPRRAHKQAVSHPRTGEAAEPRR